MVAGGLEVLLSYKHYIQGLANRLIRPCIYTRAHQQGYQFSSTLKPCRLEKNLYMEHGVRSGSRSKSNLNSRFGVSRRLAIGIAHFRSRVFAMVLRVAAGVD